MRTPRWNVTTTEHVAGGGDDEGEVRWTERMVTCSLPVTSDEFLTLGELRALVAAVDQIGMTDDAQSDELLGIQLEQRQRVS